MLTIDLNSDLGESFGSYTISNDNAVLKYVSSANIACGFHAGDPQVMKETVKKALENDVSIGAHPGFPDLKGFGRRPMQISFSEAKTYVMYQIGALDAFVKSMGGTMQHVKPHGALYNMASKDYDLARAIAEGVYSVNDDLILMGLAGGELVQAGKDVGLKTVNEVFADRTYTNEGKLVDRSLDGSVISDRNKATLQVLNIVKNGKVTAIDGTDVEIDAQSICVHGDNKEAIALVKHLKETLTKENIQIRSFAK